MCMPDMMCTTRVWYYFKTIITIILNYKPLRERNNESKCVFYGFSTKCFFVLFIQRYLKYMIAKNVCFAFNIRKCEYISHQFYWSLKYKARLC